MASMTEVARPPQAAHGGRYSTPAILLHWLIAAAIVLQVVLANRMEGPRTPEHFAITQLHKSIGITILLLSLARLGWRLANPPAPMPEAIARWERVLARVTHVGFYVIMIGMPLTGWLMVSASRLQIPTLLYGMVPWPDMPGIAHLAPGAKKIAHDLGETSHGLLAKGIYVLLALHVAGALKHQLFTRDEPVLARMAPGAQAGRWFDPRLIVIAAAFLGVIAFGAWVTPPPPGMAPRSAPQTEPSAQIGAGGAPAEGPPQQPTEPRARTPADATPVAAATPSAALEPARWIVQPGSTLGFTSAWSGAPLTGRFEKWQADILFSPDALDRSKVSVSIDLASVDTGDQQRDAALPGDDWFDVAAHPKAVFVARTFEKVGPDRYVAHGSLDLRGVEKPVDLAFRLRISGDTARANGTAALDRSAFGVGQGEWAATDQIPGRVNVAFDIIAARSSNHRR